MKKTVLSFTAVIDGELTDKEKQTLYDHLMAQLSENENGESWGNGDGGLLSFTMETKEKLKDDEE